MPRTKGALNKKKTTTTTTTTKKKTNRRRNNKALYSDSKIFRCTQLAPTKVVSNASATVDSTYGWAFQLSDIEQSAQFTGLFDQYRIDKVEVTFLPRADVFRLANISSSFLATPPTYWYSAIDYDDNNVPANRASIRQYGNSKVHLCDGKPKKITFSPRTVSPVYSGEVVTTSYMTNKSQWIDVASPNVKHFGLKLAIPATGLVSTVQGEPDIINTIGYDVSFKYFLSFKHIR